MTEDALTIAFNEEKFSESLSEDKLEALTQMVDKLVELNGEVIRADHALKAAKKSAATVSGKMIPEFMTELGVAGLQLPDGRNVSVTEGYYGQANTEAQLEWLVNNGHGSIIKNELVVTVPPKSEPEQLELLEKSLFKLGVKFTPPKQSVHAGTLKSFLKEDVVSGALEVPHELFNVYTAFKTIIK